MHIYIHIHIYIVYSIVCIYIYMYAYVCIYIVFTYEGRFMVLVLSRFTLPDSLSCCQDPESVMARIPLSLARHMKLTQFLLGVLKNGVPKHWWFGTHFRTAPSQLLRSESDRWCRWAWGEDAAWSNLAAKSRSFKIGHEWWGERTTTSNRRLKSTSIDLSRLQMMLYPAKNTAKQAYIYIYINFQVSDSLKSQEWTWAGFEGRSLVCGMRHPRNTPMNRPSPSAGRVNKWGTQSWMIPAKQSLK